TRWSTPALSPLSTLEEPGRAYARGGQVRPQRARHTADTETEDQPMLRSTNPILNRQGAFAPAQPRGYQQSGGYGGGFDQRFLSGPGGQPQGAPPQAPQRPEGRMTIDDVIAKSAILFAAMMATAV